MWRLVLLIGLLEPTWLLANPGKVTHAKPKCNLDGVLKELWDTTAWAGPPAEIRSPLLTPDETIGVVVPHGFGLAAAQERVSQLLTYWRERFEVESAWRGDCVCLAGSILGMDVEALFVVTPREVVATAKDPGWLWRGRVRNYVERKLKKYLHPTYQEP